MQFPQLNTARLTLRELQAHDNASMLDIFSDSRVTRYYNIKTFYALQDADELIVRRQNRFWRGRGICWGIELKESGGLIGTCGYNAWRRQRQIGDLGYELAYAYWNQGIMTEALTAVVSHGFEQIGLQRQRAWVMPGNVASSRVLTKLGFASLGIRPSRGYWSGRFHDLELFVLENPHTL